MNENGLAPLGFMKRDVKDGSHIVMLYEDDSDLLEVLPAYFIEGINNNEKCIIVYSNERIRKKIEEMIGTIVNVRQCIQDGRLNFINYRDFYFTQGAFLKEYVFHSIDSQIAGSLSSGFERVRAAGNMFWVDEKCLEDVLDYESGLTERYRRSKILIICAYPVKRLILSDIIDITQSHMMILYKKGGEWYLSETMERKAIREEIKSLESFAKPAPIKEPKAPGPEKHHDSRLF